MAFDYSTHRVSDQASRLREMVKQRASTVAIAITSGKGGVGKSNIALNLSICLSARAQKITLLDLDLGLANLDLLMDIQPRDTLSHVVSGLRSMEEIIVIGPGGIRFIPGASGLHELASLSEFERQRLCAQFRSLEINTDIMVLDCGAGVGRNVLSFALAADRVLVVTTPQPPAMADAYAMIKALVREQQETSIGLLVNMAESRAEAARTYQRIAKVAQRFLHFALADCGYILQDMHVASAVEQRCPFVIRYPDCNASACVDAIAHCLSRAVAGGRHRGGFFSRVASLFV